MNKRSFTLGLIVGVLVTSVVFLTLRRFPDPATDSKPSTTSIVDSGEPQRIQRHEKYFWVEEFMGLVETSFTEGGRWQPSDYGPLMGNGTLVSIDFGTYDTHTVDGIEYTKIFVQLPLDLKVGDTGDLKPFAPVTDDVDALINTDNLFLKMQHNEVAVTRFMNPMAGVISNDENGVIGSCEVLAITPEFVTIHLKLSVDVELETLELDREFQLKRTSEIGG